MTGLSTTQRYVGDGVTQGTVIEYDDWQWCVVTELALDRETPKVGFVLLDELRDDITLRLEKAGTCIEHYEAVEEFRETEHEYWTTVEYLLDADIWTVLGPIHSDCRSDSDD